MWRLSTRHDDARLIALWDALNTEDVADHPPKLQFMQASLTMLREHPLRGRFVVLELDANVRGYALLANFWSNEQGGEVCVIDELYVEPAYRGRGHAKALIQGIVDGNGIWPVRPAAVELEVSPANSRARALYERLGFRVLRNHSMRLIC